MATNAYAQGIKFIDPSAWLVPFSGSPKEGVAALKKESPPNKTMPTSAAAGAADVVRNGMEAVLLGE